MEDTRLFRQFHVLHSRSGFAGGAAERERPPSTSPVRVRTMTPGLWASLFSASLLAGLALPVTEPARARQSAPHAAEGAYWGWRVSLLARVLPGRPVACVTWFRRMCEAVGPSDGSTRTYVLVRGRLVSVNHNFTGWRSPRHLGIRLQCCALECHGSRQGKRSGSIAGFSGRQPPRLAFLRSGPNITSTNSDGFVCMRSNPSGKGRWHLHLSAPSVDTTCIAVARNGGTFALGLEDGTIEVWETETFRILATFQPHDRRVRALAFSPSGRTLASISALERDVTLWDRDRGMRQRAFRHQRVAAL